MVVTAVVAAAAVVVAVVVAVVAVVVVVAAAVVVVVVVFDLVDCSSLSLSLSLSLIPSYLQGQNIPHSIWQFSSVKTLPEAAKAAKRTAKAR